MYLRQHLELGEAVDRAGDVIVIKVEAAQQWPRPRRPLEEARPELQRIHVPPKLLQLSEAKKGQVIETPPQWMALPGRRPGVAVITLAVTDLS